MRIKPMIAKQTPLWTRESRLLLIGGLLLPVLAHPSQAYAYLGPGSAVSAVGTLIALLAAILIAIIGFVWFPIRRMMRRSHKTKQDDSIAQNTTISPISEQDSQNG